jgi:hypothetical protein
MDRTIDSTATKHPFVRSVNNCIAAKCRYVSPHNLYFTHSNSSFVDLFYTPPASSGRPNAAPHFEHLIFIAHPRYFCITNSS